MKKYRTAGEDSRADRKAKTARTVTILLNQRCPFKCRHCSQGFSASYRGGKEPLKPAVLRKIIRAIAASNYKLALLAGGEPSLNPELAALGVRECAKAGLTSAMITAPVWAKSAESAGAFLDKIAGLNLLILSYDQFHLESLSFAHYKNAAAAAFKRDIPVEIATMYLNETDRKRQLASLKPIKRYLASVTALPVVAVGNAAALGTSGRKTVKINSEKDLNKLPATCSAGKVSYVDPKLKLYGCCWSAYGGSSPFDLPPRAGETLAARFARLERIPAFRQLLRKGFLNSLSPRGREYAAAAVKGGEFCTECDLCIALMRQGRDRIWQEVACK
jgi:pyruvate-formate lyase-activating enzyme